MGKFPSFIISPNIIPPLAPLNHRQMPNKLTRLPKRKLDAGRHQPLLTSLARLQKIDQLRDKNIGSFLPLPQLVAVGDQSSGKSSLLESLSGIPFPRGQELCTCYATQISHRREPTQSIVITVIPGPHATEDHKKTLESYKKQLQTTTQLRGNFPSILTDVCILHLVSYLPLWILTFHSRSINSWESKQRPTPTA